MTFRPGIDHFNKVSSTYDSSQKVSDIATRLVSLAPPIVPTSVVIDNACGPGTITRAIKSLATQPSRIHTVDLSTGMIDQVLKNNWSDVEAQVMDAQELKFHDGMFTHSFTNMGVFLFPDPEKGVREIYRTLAPGGTAVVTSIKQVGWPRIFQAAQRKVRPDAPLWKGLLEEEWSTREKLESVMIGGGFIGGNVKWETAGMTMPGNMLDPFLESIREGATAMITKGWAEEEKEAFGIALAEQIELVKANGERFEVETWVAIAEK